MVLKNLFTGQQWRNRESRLIDMGRGEERERYMETYIAICKIDSQWEFAVWLRKLKPGLCINLEGWGGEGGSLTVTSSLFHFLVSSFNEVQKGGDICNTYGWFMLSLTENEIL